MALRASLTVSLTFLAATLAATLGTPGVAEAQQPSPVGNAQNGAKLAYTCNGCHGVSNYKNVYPTYSVPKLRGQRPEYLLAALKAYKSGERSHGTMHSQAVSMTEEDMRDIAAYLAGPDVLTESKNDTSVTRPKATDVCVACHGTNGVGITADYPTLSGQYRDYLARALTDYKKGGRKNAIMAPMAATLTPEDIEQLAAFYSAQRPSLEILEKRRFFFSSN